MRNVASTLPKQQATVMKKPMLKPKAGEKTKAKSKSKAKAKAKGKPKAKAGAKSKEKTGFWVSWFVKILIMIGIVNAMQKCISIIIF